MVEDAVEGGGGGRGLEYSAVCVIRVSAREASAGGTRGTLKRPVVEESKKK